MPQYVIGISDIYVSRDRDINITTYALGSCIGVTAYDPAIKAGGMIHFMLPLSKTSPDKAAAKPGMFADTGIPEMFKQLYALGVSKERLIVKVAGGAQLLDKNKVFNIGERNYLVLRKLLWKNNVLIKAEDIGGNLSRTMKLEIGTGRVIVRSPKGVIEL